MTTTAEPTTDPAADEAALVAASVQHKHKRTKAVEAPPTPERLAVTVERERLRAALRTVATAASSGRAMLPVTANVLMWSDGGAATATGGALRLTCTNLEVRLSVEVPATVQGDGAFTVPARLLSDLVGSLSGPEVSLAHDGAVLRVACGTSRGQLKGIDASEFPPERAGGGDSFTVPAAVLGEAVTLTEWAVARDLSRPVLRCVCLQHKGSSFVAQSADGSAMAHLLLPPLTGVDGVPDFEALVPLAGAEALERLLAGHGGDDGTEVPAVPVTLLPDAAHPNVLRVTMGGELPATLSLRTAEGQFPDLLRVVPKTATTTVRVPREPLLAIVRQASLVTSRTAGKEGFRPQVQLWLRADPVAGTLAIWGRDAGRGEHTAELPATVTGEPVEWSLDATYVVGLLTALDGPDRGEMEIALNGALSPVVFRCPTLPGYLAVAMPLHGGPK